MIQTPDSSWKREHKTFRVEGWHIEIMELSLTEKHAGRTKIAGATIVVSAVSQFRLSIVDDRKLAEGGDNRGK